MDKCPRCKSTVKAEFFCDLRTGLRCSHTWHDALPTDTPIEDRSHEIVINDGLDDTPDDGDEAAFDNWLETNLPRKIGGTDFRDSERIGAKKGWTAALSYERSQTKEDATVSYMTGFEKGKDSRDEEVKELKEKWAKAEANCKEMGDIWDEQKARFEEEVERLKVALMKVDSGDYTYEELMLIAAEALKQEES